MSPSGRAELLVAAALADPLAPAGGTTRLDGADPARVIELLQINKVPLLEIAGGPLAGSTIWEEAVAREQKQRQEQVAEYEQVADRMAARGISPVLFKSPGGFPYRSSNLDLLVRPAEFETAAVLLEELGHLRLTHYREDHKRLFRKFRHGSSVLCVHLHEAVSWGKVLILDGDGVVSRSRPRSSGESGFAVASAEDLMLITLAHILYETDQVRLSDLRALRLAAARGTRVDWARIAEIARLGHWSTSFSSILSIVTRLERALHGSTSVPADALSRMEQTLDRSFWARLYVRRSLAELEAGGSPTMPYPLSKVWSKLHAVARMIRSPDRSAAGRIADVLDTGWGLLAVRARLRCRPPVVVSLTGLDGSGKSSVVRVLRDAMDLCEIPVRVVWSRGGFTRPMQSAKRAARVLLREGVPGPAEMERKRRWLAGTVGGAGFAAIVVAEQAMHHLVRVRAARWRGLSVVCDRFAFDAVADLEAKLGPGRPLARAAGRLVVGLAPRPDLAVLLRLAPGEAAARKPGDAPSEILEQQAVILNRVAAVWGLRVVDASRPDEVVAGEVVELALRKAFDRFGRGRA